MADYVNTFIGNLGVVGINWTAMMQYAMYTVYLICVLIPLSLLWYYSSYNIKANILERRGDRDLASVKDRCRAIKQKDGSVRYWLFWSRDWVDNIEFKHILTMKSKPFGTATREVYLLKYGVGTYAPMMVQDSVDTTLKMTPLESASIRLGFLSQEAFQRYQTVKWFDKYGIALVIGGGFFLLSVTMIVAMVMLKNYGMALSKTSEMIAANQEAQSAILAQLANVVQNMNAAQIPAAVP